MTGLSAGSKTIYTVGAAVLEAAQDARRQTLEIAARELEASVARPRDRGRRVVVRGVPDRAITLAPDRQEGQPLHVQDAAGARRGRPGFSEQAPGFAAQLARIEVDPDTGEITLHDFVVAQDVGKAINPLGVEGQMQGGAVQSLGLALTEGLLFDDEGRLTNPSLLDYRKLTAADLPEHRDDHRRGAGARRSLRRARRRRAAHRPGAGGHRQRRRGRHRLRLTELPITPERVALGVLAQK